MLTTLLTAWYELCGCTKFTASSSMETPDICCRKLLACVTNCACAEADVLASLAAFPTRETSEPKYWVKLKPLICPPVTLSKLASFNAIPLETRGGPGSVAANWLGVMAGVTPRLAATPAGGGGDV